MNSTSHTGDYLEKLQLTLKAISNFLGDRFKIHIKSKSPDQLHSVAHLCWDLWSLIDQLRLCIYNVRIDCYDYHVFLRSWLAGDSLTFPDFHL